MGGGGGGWGRRGEKGGIFTIMKVTCDRSIEFGRTDSIIVSPHANLHVPTKSNRLIKLDFSLSFGRFTSAL